jgi:hypothetical protein
MLGIIAYDVKVSYAIGGIIHIDFAMVEIPACPHPTYQDLDFVAITFTTAANVLAAWERIHA